jgi:hypothetical protein
MPSHESYFLTLSFGHRAAEGEDMARLLREHMPEAQPRAVLDDRGAVTGYDLNLYFPSAEAAFDAGVMLTQFFRDEGIPFDVGDPREAE